MANLIKNTGYLKKGIANYGGSNISSLSISNGNDMPFFLEENYNDSESIVKISNNQVVLKAGKKYKLTASCGSMPTTTGYVYYRFYNISASTYFGSYGLSVSASYSSDNGMANGAAQAIISPSVDTTISIKASSIGGGPLVALQVPSVIIEEIEAYLPTLPYDSTPVGTMQMYAGTTAPSGWFLCEGTAISRSTYSRLFSVISTSFGVGDNSTTFNLPDMRGAAPAGVGTSTGYTANETVALGTKYDDKFQGHWHKTALNSSLVGGGASGANVTTGGGNYAATSISDPIADASNGTPRTAAFTKGKTVGVNFIIKY